MSVVSGVEFDLSWLLFIMLLLVCDCVVFYVIRYVIKSCRDVRYECFCVFTLCKKYVSLTMLVVERRVLLLKCVCVCR